MAIPYARSKVLLTAFDALARSRTIRSLADKLTADSNVWEISRCLTQAKEVAQALHITQVIKDVDEAFNFIDWEKAVITSLNQLGISLRKIQSALEEA